VQAHDVRPAVERAEHHADAAVLPQVGDGLPRRCGEVEVGERVLVKHLERAARALRRDVDEPVPGERRGAHEEERLRFDERGELGVDALVDLGHDPTVARITPR
jgi:hypothetical protein